MTKGVEISILCDGQWLVTDWMSGASAAELRNAVAELRVRYPGRAIRVTRNGNLVSTPR